MADFSDIAKTLLQSLDREAAAKSVSFGALAAVVESASANFAQFAAEGLLPGLDATSVGALAFFGSFSVFRWINVKRREQDTRELKSKFLAAPTVYLSTLETACLAEQRQTVKVVEKQLANGSISDEQAFDLVLPLLKLYIMGNG